MQVLILGIAPSGPIFFYCLDGLLCCRALQGLRQDLRRETDFLNILQTPYRTHTERQKLSLPLRSFIGESKNTNTKKQTR